MAEHIVNLAFIVQVVTLAEALMITLKDAEMLLLRAIVSGDAKVGDLVVCGYRRDQ